MTTPTPFADAALDYHARGFHPIPLPPGSKVPQMKGVTGKDGIDADEAQLRLWARTHATGNVALRMSADLVGIDVDHYDKNGTVKRGLDTIAALERDLGPLPDTMMSTSRDGGSGIRYYRVPAGTRLVTGLTDVDIIQRHHRCAVVAPSTNPDNGGATYRWIDTATGEVLETPWHHDEIPMLPQEWIDHLRATHDTASAGAASSDQVTAFIAAHTASNDPARLRGIRTMLDRRAATVLHPNGKGRHDTAADIVCTMAKEAAAGAYSAAEGIEQMRSWWLEVMADEPDRHGNEFDAIIARGVAEALAQPDEIADIAAGIAARTVHPRTVSDPPPVPTSTPAANPDRYIDRKDGLRARVLVADILANVAIRTGIDGELWNYHAGVWLPDGRRTVDATCIDLLGDRFRESYANTALRILKAAPPTIGDSEPTDLLNFRNGLLQLGTGRLLDHTPDVVSTYQVPHNWNPDAGCPTVDRWLAEVFPPDAIDFVWEIIGYLLYPANPLHRAILLHATGRNGKSTFMRLVEHIIGLANISAVTLQQLGEDRFAAANLYRKVANIAGDLDARSILRTDLFKKATGGDPLQGERKYGQPFTFTYFGTFMFAANELPGTGDLTEGFFSRWLVVPFTGYFPAGHADRAMPKKLTAEAEGVIAKAVPALRRLLDRGDFDLPTSVLDATADYRVKADPMMQFIDDVLDLVPDGREVRSKVYDTYRTWCHDNGYQPCARGKFAQRLIALRPSIGQRKIGGHWHLVGIEITNAWLGHLGASSLSPTRAYGGKLGSDAPNAPTGDGERWAS